MISRMRNGTTASWLSQLDSRQIAAQKSQWLRRGERAMAERPKTSLIAALATGVVLGWIIKRL
jgi:hypothetical protein